MEFTRIQRYSREWRKKEPEALVSHKMYTEEDNDRYIAQCFVNGLYASDGEINLEKNDNLISNDYAVKLCLEYELGKGKEVVTKELKWCLLLVNFGEGTITIQPDFDPFLLSNDEEGNPNLDNLEELLDFNINENIMYFNGARPSSSIRTPLTQEEAEKRALAHSVSMRYEMLEEVRPMLKEKKDPGAFLFPIRLEDRINENALADTGSDTNTMPYKIYEQLGRDDIMKEERNITMINYTEAKVTGRLVNVLCQVGFTTLSAKFLILEIPTLGAYDLEVGSSCAKRSRNVKTVEEALLLDVHHELLEWRGCSRREAQTEEEVFFSVAWVRAFDIREPIYLELFREFYATYEFDEVCTDNELQSKKIISFRLGGCAHSLTLLEFARRLGLYHVDELEEEGFDTYFQGGLRSDENFNAREYWERISLDRDLHLSRSSITSVRFLILRVLHKMITYGLCQMTTGYEKIQRNTCVVDMLNRHHNGYGKCGLVIAKWIKGRSWKVRRKDNQICCGQFISKISRKSRVLIEEIICSLSTPVYCRDFDRTTLREFIDSRLELIPDIRLMNDTEVCRPRVREISEIHARIYMSVWVAWRSDRRR
ncbi:retrotransposon ORF1 [Tanacetum coccineum]